MFANAITLSRLLLTFVVIAVFGQHNTLDFALIAAIVIIFVLDAVDGYIARKRNETSKLGEVLDTVADRIIENTFWIYFAAAALIPLWMPIAVMARGFITDSLQQFFWIPKTRMDTRPYALCKGESNLKDDAALIQQLRDAKDEEAADLVFQEIVRKHSKFVLDCAFAILKNREDAEEVANDTFLKVFHKREQLTTPEKFVGWLRTIVTRTAQDRLREDARHDRQRLEIVESIDELPVEEDNRVSIVDSASVDAYRRARHTEAHWDRVAVPKRLIRLLPQFEDRQVMALRYYDEFNHLKHKEIARITGKTVKSVKHRIARATNLLNAVATQLNALLNILSNEEALMMRRYLFDGASHAEIAEFLGICPKQVADGLERVMTQWKKIIAKQKRTEKGTTQGSQKAGGKR